LAIRKLRSESEAAMSARFFSFILGLAMSPFFCHAKQFAPRPASTMTETVSVTELHVPSAAAKELRLSLKQFDAGDFRESARHLERVIQVDNHIPAAHHNLGVCYMRLREYEKAVGEFQRALALDPHMMTTRTSLAEALFVLRRYSEAAEAAHEAYELEPKNPIARYLFSRILAIEGHDTPEVIEMLRASRAQFPAAHLVLACMLLKQRATDDALFELREYLKRPDPPEKIKVVSMIERLTNSGGAATCAMN
jgi:tetratricopeptide (TPR) repeat protein